MKNVWVRLTDVSRTNKVVSVKRLLLCGGWLVHFASGMNYDNECTVILDVSMIALNCRWNNRETGLIKINTCESDKWGLRVYDDVTVREASKIHPRDSLKTFQNAQDGATGVLTHPLSPRPAYRYQLDCTGDISRPDINVVNFRTFFLTPLRIMSREFYVPCTPYAYPVSTWYNRLFVRKKQNATKKNHLALVFPLRPFVVGCDEYAPRSFFWDFVCV